MQWELSRLGKAASFGDKIMEKYAKAYAAFVVMTLVTAIVVRPLVNQMNVPLLKGNI